MNPTRKFVALGLAGAMFALAFMAAVFGQNQPARSKPVFLDQGWSEEDRLKYYFTSQGSAVMFYDIFLTSEAFYRAQMTRHTQMSVWVQAILDPSRAPAADTVGVFYVRLPTTF